MRSFILAVLLLVIGAAPAAAAPILTRSAVDPGQLVMYAPSAAGERQGYVLQGTGPVTFRYDFETVQPKLNWNIGAADCSQSGDLLVVTCTAPVTSVSVTMGDGEDSFDINRTAPFAILGSMGAGRDYIGGGIGDDTIDAGPGTDIVNGDKGADVIVGGEDDDQLSGGPGADSVEGGLGRDRLFGDGGVDLIRARDGETDGRIECGPGSDKKERAKVDPGDPRARSC